MGMSYCSVTLDTARSNEQLPFLTLLKVDRLPCGEELIWFLPQTPGIELLKP